MLNESEGWALKQAQVINVREKAKVRRAKNTCEDGAGD